MNIGKMMKDLQKMQGKMQTEVEKVEVEASSGGGIVTATMNGKKAKRLRRREGLMQKRNPPQPATGTKKPR